MIGLVAIGVGIGTLGCKSGSAEEARQGASFAKNHAITPAYVAQLEEMDRLASSGKVRETWTLFDRHSRSSDEGERYEAYRSMVTWGRFPAFKSEVVRHVEAAKADSSKRVRDSYPLLLILAGAPDALTKAMPYTQSPDPETRAVAVEAVQWAQQNGVGVRP